SQPDASPYVVSIAVENLKSEVLLHYLEKKEIYVSSGSACSKGKKSSVLGEFGHSAVSDVTLRISFSSESSEADIDSLIAEINNARSELAKLKK
ncbi:MAG: aminotransferase class V-fold PLP-dependent enzyme, partial [Ruminococcus sp.]|nr:aminotransferase class V-fold PLP-dependent enzyme [Ruminococcus sp.]